MGLAKGTKFVKTKLELGPSLEARWVPVILIRSLGEECFYAFYCFPNSLRSSSILRLLTFFKVPADLELTGEPDKEGQNVLEWGCGDINIREDLEHVLNLVGEIRGTTTGHLDWGSLALFHILSPLVIRRKLEELSSAFSAQITASMLEKVATLLATRVNLWGEMLYAYILHMFDVRRRSVRLVIDERSFENRALSAVIFRNEELLKLFLLR